MRGTISLVAIVLLLAGILGGADIGATASIARAADAVRAIGDGDPTLDIDHADGQVVVRATAGTADIGDIAEALAAAGQRGLRRDRRGTWTLAGSVVVGRGATVVLRDTALRMTATASLRAAGGTVALRRASLTGWDPRRNSADAKLSDGRAWLLATDSGTITADDTRLTSLGHDAVGRQGVSASGAGSQIRLTSATVTDGFDGIHVADGAVARIRTARIVDARRHGVASERGRAVTIDDVNIIGSAAHGVLVNHAHDTTVVHSTVHANHGGGITLRKGSVGAVIADNAIYNNPSAGVVVNDCRSVDVRDNLLHTSKVGIAIRGDSAKVTVTDNRVTSNRTDGIWIGERATARVTGNHVDFNNEAAVSVKSGTATVTDNLLTRNFDGVRLETPPDQHISGVVRDNDIRNNVQDGVDLPAGPTLPVADNTIVDNREGGVSVETAGDGRATIARNEVRDNGRGDERVRQPSAETQE